MRYLKIVFVLIILASIPYYKTIVFDFEKGKPFSGSMFYNPYENITQNWIKANFHAHTKLYFGIANGENSPEEMYNRYDSLGYDLACISNYNSILPDNYNQKPYIPTYEHGRNFGTIHQLVINTERVNNYDFFLFQNRHHKQSVINSQTETGELITIAHANFKKGYSKEDIELLNNYELFEGVSVMASSIDLWDVALSNGHAVWVTGGDDAHSNRKEKTGVCWTMINATDTSKEDITEALKRGAAYAQRGWKGQEMHRISKLTVKDGVYELKLKNKADSIILKSDFGKTVAFATNSKTISYKIAENNSYIRAEIFETEPWNTYTKSYLNPVIRTENGDFIAHNNLNVPNKFKTWLLRISIFMVNVFMLAIVFITPLKRIRKSKKA